MSADQESERPLAAVLAEAAAAAGTAPSVHNTQPWRWVVHQDSMDLRAERSRQLTTTDPEGWLLLLSCGAALHHARIALAAEGFQATVARLPDPADPDLLARVGVSGPIEVVPEAMRMFQAALVRHTDRRPVIDTPLPPSALVAIMDSVRSEDAHLHVLDPAQVLELAAATSRAERGHDRDPAVTAELAYWSGPDHPPGTGVPATAIPASTPQTTVPGRDFGHPGQLVVGTGHAKGAVYAILYGESDEPEGWLRAGEAMSAVWLTATRHGVAMLPFSAVVEVPDTRAWMRQLLADVGVPYLAIRFGIADPDVAGPPHTPRLPATETVDTSPLHGSASG